jgi:arylamine N-acetyltransferase
MDFEVANFYSHKHKNANFVKNLVLSKISDDKILSLRNNTYHKIYPNKIILMNDYLLQEIVTLKKYKKKISIIPNFIEFNKFEKIRNYNITKIKKNINNYENLNILTVT